MIPIKMCDAWNNTKQPKNTATYKCALHNTRGIWQSLKCYVNTQYSTPWNKHTLLNVGNTMHSCNVSITRHWIAPRTDRRNTAAARLLQYLFACAPIANIPNVSFDSIRPSSHQVCEVSERSIAPSNSPAMTTRHHYYHWLKTIASCSLSHLRMFYYEHFVGAFSAIYHEIDYTTYSSTTLI